MKAVFIGGGAHRLLGIIRSALARPGLFENGEIVLVDIDSHRAEAMGRMVMKCPEARGVNCRVRWDLKLEEALDGADAVSVVLRAGSPQNYLLGQHASIRSGFLSSDNVSMNGAFLALKGCDVIMDIARKMERLCPNAWLLDFANPVAVFSGMVNLYTRIKCLGVCAGFMNHMWDLSRLIDGEDTRQEDVQVTSAGVNHMSFILGGTYRGTDIFDRFNEAMDKSQWTPSKFKTKHPDRSCRSLELMIQAYRTLDALFFSSEQDGMAHIFPDEPWTPDVDKLKAERASPASVENEVLAGSRIRDVANKRFAELASADLDDKSFWFGDSKEARRFRQAGSDVFVRALEGIGGTKKTFLAASRPNNGAIVGIAPRTIVEYSLTLEQGECRAAGTFTLPTAVSGMTNALAVHQTLLADACATGDPHILAQALLTYPVRPYSNTLRKLIKELIEINKSEITPNFACAGDFV